MNDYELGSLTPRDMDKDKEPTKPDEQKDEPRVYIESTLNPTGRTLMVVLDDYVIERVPIN